MEFTVTDVVDAEGLHRLCLTGSLDLATRALLTSAADHAFAGPVHDELVIDMAGVTFMDSTGIGALVQISKTARSAGVGFALEGPTERIRRILTLTGLQSWIRDIPTEATPTD